VKYFIDFEFIEGFHKPLFGKRRHFIDLISVGMVSEDNRALYFLSSEYNYKDADQWVMENVITKAYTKAVSGDARNRFDATNFHKHYGIPVSEIAKKILRWLGADSNISFYGYYSDYDWVLFCSMFGRMIDLPKGFPMYCRDVKQMMDDRGVDSCHPECPKQNGEHYALTDAAWNMAAYKWLITIPTK
jgi:hypothetical protein